MSSKPTRFEVDPVVERRQDRAFLVGVDRGDRAWPVDESLEELARLADTAGATVVGSITQRLQRPDPRTFIGTGKADEVARAAREAGADVIIFDDDLTPSQQGNLEGVADELRILDRTGLILDIFALHATSREGKLQVELARMVYVLPRLRGMWGHLVRERLGGGRGARFGAGESQLETDRRMTRKRIGELNRELKQVARERTVQRSRRARSGVYRVSLVGYTNAGKSTLMSALTGADVLIADQLFATLDATTRTLDLPEGRKVTLTDTVGFINKLPHGLVEAFKTTLDETREADLLLHVVDAASPQAREQMAAVAEVLGEIGVAGKPQIVVFNKADLLDASERAALLTRSAHALVVSAATGEGLDALRSRIGDEAARGAATLTVVVPYERGDIVGLAHEQAQIIVEEHIPEGTRLTVRVDRSIAARFEPFLEAADAGGADGSTAGE